MRNAISSIVKLLVTILFLLPFSANGATENWVTSLSGKPQQPGNAVHPITNGAYVTTSDQWYVYMLLSPSGSGTNAWDNIFTVEKAEGIVRLRFDDSDRKRLTGNMSAGAVSWTLDISYIITVYDATGASTTYGTTLAPEVVSIAYDPNTGSYIDKAQRVYTNAHKATITILSAANNGVVYKEFNYSGVQVGSTAGTPPSYLKDIWLDVELDVDRVYYMGSSTPHVYQFTPVNNQFVISWPYIQGAESYDVEWLFVDVPTGVISSSSAEMNFANATRINTFNKFYSISLAYPRGKIIYRIRGVGRDPLSPSTRYEGPWSYDPAVATPISSVSSNVGTTWFSYDYDGLEDDLNWQYSASYVEDGKRAEAISFYDGSLHGRQNVTLNNADNTAIISETKYDYQGRPAVSIMPSVENSIGLQYYQYNTGSNYYALNPYTRLNFDIDSKVNNSDGMAATSGAGEYYSSSNPGIGTAADYIPDAGGYPYAQVRYMNDGTGRLRSQGGVGPVHQIGDGHETQFFYGTPSGQEELDRLFGNEVGYVSHYKKNLVVDANGQVSITYLDQEGRIVATALAGDSPNNLIALDSSNSSQTLTVSLLGNNHLSQQQDMVSQNNLTVSAPGNYNFSYSLNSTQHCSSCMVLLEPIAGCLDCIYDLTIMITNTDGDSIDINGVLPGYGYHLDAIASQSPPLNFTVNFTNVGIYTVTKVLRLSSVTQDAYMAAYIAVQTDPLNETPCVTKPIYDPIPCTYGCEGTNPGATCAICTEIYTTGTDGGGDYYIDPNDVTHTHIYGQPRLDSIAHCNSVICDHVVPPIQDPCETKYNQMLNDMSPGGQYLDNSPSLYIADLSNPTGPSSPNLDYLSYYSDIGYTSGDENNWLVTHVHNETSSGWFHTNFGSTINNWKDVRDNWNPAWLPFLMPYHPEYCAYNYFCGGVSCSIDGTTFNYNRDLLFAYEQQMITTHNNTLNNSGTDGLFNPTGLTGLSFFSNGIQYNDHRTYGPNTTPTLDPYFKCDHEVCDDPAHDAETIVETMLKNYIPVYDPSGTTLTGYYSIWYLLDDPDNIANCTTCTTIDSRIVDLFTNLHQQITAGVFTKYDYFRGAYMYFKEMTIAMGYDEYISASSGTPPCVANQTTSMPYHDGYLVTNVSLGNFTPDGFTAHFPQNPMFDGINGCDVVANTIDLLALIQGNMDNVLPGNCAATCSAFSYDWMTTLGSCISPSDTATVRALLVQICSCSCDGTNPLGTDDCVTGVHDVVSGLDFYSFSDVIAHYGTGCTTPVHPPAEEASGTCSCQNLTDFIDATGLDPANTTDQVNITTAFNDLFEPAGSYTWLQIDAWLTTCNAAEPDIANLTTLPEPIKCAAATEPENDFVTQAGLDCEEESNEIAANQANTMYDYMLNLAANTYINSYRASCLDLAGKEAFTVTYDLQEYYYTLYYYDQAATLIKTVPPEGVHPIYSSAALTAVQNHRVDPATYPSPTYPPHTMETNNKFNSFQQCVEGTTPDGGTTKVWYDEQGRIIATQNAKQYAYTPPGYSYVLYDALGRPYEAGETYSATTLTYEISRNQNTSAPYNFNDWVTSAIAAGATQVVHTYYDEQIPGSSTSTYIPGGQKNLRNRISSVTYEEVRNISDLSNTYGREYNLPTLFDNATHYSYDIHGNALVVMQQNTDLNLTLIGQSKKRIDYEYDVASGKVNAVHYQQNISSTLPTPDEFHHKYVYDANNRVVSAYTSRDGYIWDTDARYFYYAHGPVSRVEIGDKTVQGEDFAYTIGGWLKGVNSDTRDAERDMGKDGSSSSTGLNYSFGRDAFGYSLSYYNGDYLSVTTQTLAGNFLASQTNVTNNFHTGFYELFNGNIAAMTTAITNANEASLDVQGRDFRYDQLNRIKQVNAYKDATNLVANNYWGTGTADNGDYYEDFSYDMNGNIMNVRRNGNLTTTHQQMDLLTYNYTANTNRLDIVIDATSCVASDYGNDIDGSAGTYVYDAIGNLTEDPSEQIDNIEWTVSGKLKQVTRIATSTKADLEFVYDAMGNRIAKIVKPRPGGNASAQELWTYTYYVRDGSGNVLAVYDRSFVDKSGGAYEDHFNLKEWDIYGSGRLGVKHPDDGSSNIIRNFTATHSGLLFDILSMSYSSPGPVFSPVNGCLLTRKLGKKEYEEANHLGNVLESVSDMKYAVGTTSSVDYYIPDVISYSDYYAFGAPQPGRTGGDPYRYKFNGMETDPESKNGEGLDYTTEYRAYDARVGRWFSPDPIVKPWESPYAAFANNPVYYIDPSGLDPGDGTGKVAGGGASKAGKSSSLENVHADPRAGTVIIFGPADFKIPPPVVNGPVKLDIPNTGDPDVGPGKNGPISTRESGPLSTNTDVGVSQTAQTLSQETTAINGGAVWGGLTYIKASNLRTLYSAESKQRFTENTFENRFGRFELKARIREQTPQPIKNALDRTNPMTEEWMKVSTRNNPGKSNPQYNNGAKYFGIVGKVVTAYGIYLSVQNVYYAPQPAKQIVIEGGFWTGAYYGGVIGATYGIEFGPWGGLVGGLAMGTIGGICGRATAEAIVNAPNPYSEYLSEHPLDRDHPENLIYHICFAKGTLVYSKSGLVPIESIQIGDSVFTYDSLANRIELGQVTNILSHQANEIYSLQTTNQRILATADHPFYVEGKGWTSVNKLQVGDKLRTNINGNFEEIKNLQLTSQSVSVYNIEVDKNHNYFVTNNKILVHNKYISPSVIQKLKQENLKTKRPNPQ